MMRKLTSPSWWIDMFMGTFMTLVFLYLIKKITTAVEIPIVSGIVEETL